jgi:hypothetical protein
MWNSLALDRDRGGHSSWRSTVVTIHGAPGELDKGTLSRR